MPHFPVVEMTGLTCGNDKQHLHFPYGATETKANSKAGSPSRAKAKTISFWNPKKR